MYLDSTSGWYYDLILHWTRITTSNSSTNTNVLPVRPWSSRANATPFHTFNEHKHTTVTTIVVHLYRVRLWLHNVSNTNNSFIFKFRHTPVQTHRLFNTMPFHKFNEHKHTAVIVIVVYLHNTSGWDYDLILYRTLQIETQRTHTNTNILPVRPGPTRRRSIHSTKITRSRHHHYCSVCIRTTHQGEIRTSYCIKHWQQLQIKNTRMYKNELSVRPGPTRQRIIRSTNITYSHHRHCSVFGQHMRVRYTVLDTNGSFKFKHTNTNVPANIIVQGQHDTMSYTQPPSSL